MAEAGALDPISLLCLSPRWQYDTYGVASVIRSLANDLWLTDPEGKRIQMTCAVLQEDGKINPDDVADAEKHNVKLSGVRLPRGVNRIPTAAEIDGTASFYYQHLALTHSFDFIIGHIPNLANGALNLRDLCNSVGLPSEAITLVHTLPKTNTNDIDEDRLLQWLKESKIVLSVGENVKTEIDLYIASLQEAERPIHRTYLPGCPAELLTIIQEERKRPIKGPQNITFITQERKDLEVIGSSYQLAVASSTMASENIHTFCGIQAKVQFLVLASNSEERNIWETTFNEIKEKQATKDKRLSFQFHTIEDLEKLKNVMRMTTVMLLPLKADSPLFGVEALMAAYSGVPILVASNSGMASLLSSIGNSEAIVYDTTGTLRNDPKVWSERIIQKIRDPEEAQKFAKSLRKVLLLDTSIATSHLEFVRLVTERGNHQLCMELDPLSTVLAKSLANAKKLGVDVEQKVEPNKYIAAYFTKLLLQREKLELGLLDSYIPHDVKQAWTEVLSCLEETKRKVLGVTEGSLTFTLFCPTVGSYQQLQDETWKKQLTGKLKQLLNLIGVIGSELKIVHPEEQKKFQFKQPVALPATSRLRPKGSVRDEESSSLYVTESVDPLDQMSVIHPTLRVADWLRQVESGSGSSAASVTEPTESSDWRVVERIDTGCYDPEKPRGSVMMFTIAETGNIGVSFHKTNPDEIDLLLQCPSKPKRSVNLCTGSNRFYFDPIFVEMSGKESLAAHCFTDASIHLWDIESRAPRVVFRKGSEGKKNMRLCVIDNETVAYGDDERKNGVHHVYVLNTSTQRWSHRTTLRLRTELEFVDNMCYTQLADGTSCLMLCGYREKSVLAVGMLGGKIRWCLGTKQMGEEFGPSSVCTDSDHNVYVSDPGQYKVYMLSPEGTVISTILTAQQHGIFFPFWLRMYDDHLFVAHINNFKEKKWEISKFLKR